MRVLAELLHIAAGMAVAILIAMLAAWAYPLAATDVWLVAGVAVLAIVAMGARSVQRAMAVDRRDAAGKGHDA